MNKNKVRQHYLPRCYLRGFCDQNEQIWTYKKLDPDKPFSNAISNTAVIKCLYSLSIQGKEDELENYFATDIEGPAAEALKKLRLKKFPTTIEREKLSLFFSTLFTRTPMHINHLNVQQNRQLNVYARLLASNKDDFLSHYNELKPEIPRAAAEEDRLAILQDDFTFELKDSVLMLMLQCGTEYSHFLSNMKWVLLETNEDYPFVTSDNPLNIFHPTISGRFYQPGLAMPDTRVSIPISKYLTLLLFNDVRVSDKKIIDYRTPTGKNLIKNLNKQTYINSYQYVFANGNSQKLINCFVKLLEEAERLDQKK